MSRMLDRSALRMKSDEIFLTSDESLFHGLGPVQRRECFPRVTVENRETDGGCVPLLR